jgi:ubiquinone/menaquinone biosynthesis C-methylase UbiE
MSWQVALLVILVSAGIGAQILFRIMKRRHPRPAPPWISFFLESPTRRWWQPHNEVVRRSGLAPGQRVLEVGSGSGAFTLAAARVVGMAGCVVALDIQQSMLRKLSGKLVKAESPVDVQPVRADAMELPFANGVFDAVFMVGALPEVPDPSRALTEARRVLKAGGTVAVSEIFFDPDFPRRATTIGWGRSAGFDADISFGNAMNYTVRFIK